jgi:hypothetical protein
VAIARRICCGVKVRAIAFVKTKNYFVEKCTLMTKFRWLFLAMVLLFSSCTTTQVVSKYDSNSFANNPLNQTTTWSFLWGFVKPKDVDPKCDSRANFMTKVKVKNNIGFMLLSAVTLGAVVPTRLEWSCAPYTPRIDTTMN